VSWGRRIDLELSGLLRKVGLRSSAVRMESPAGIVDTCAAPLAFRGFTPIELAIGCVLSAPRFAANPAIFESSRGSRLTLAGGFSTMTLTGRSRFSFKHRWSRRVSAGAVDERVVVAALGAEFPSRRKLNLRL